MPKTRRLQVLIEDEQFRRLEAAAGRRKVPIAVVVREALDDKLTPPRSAQRRAAARSILSAARMAVGDPDELRAELEELRAGGR